MPKTKYYLKVKNARITNAVNKKVAQQFKRRLAKAGIKSKIIKRY